MKSNTILRFMALPIVAAMMMFSTVSCSSSDNDINNQPQPVTPSEAKNYSIPVTVKVTCADNAATRATYDGNTKKLSFSSGDKLFIQGSHGTAGTFAGTLDWASEGTFNGTITTQYSYSGSADNLLSSVTSVTATLLPNGYGSYFSISGTGYSATLSTVPASAFVAGDKATGVAQLSHEKATSYSSGFDLTPQNAVLSCSISGLTASTAYTFTATDGTNSPSGSVTTDANGVATFCVAFPPNGSKTYTINIKKNDQLYTEIYLGSKTITSGTIYKITKTIFDLSTVSSETIIPDGVIVTGTYNGDKKISIADGASITLSGVEITNSAKAGLTCNGNATITLVGENKIISLSSAIKAGPSGKTLTITGSGSLTATCNGSSAAGIGGGYQDTCGDITITGGTITAKGGTYAAGIGSGNGGTCGNISISGGTVTATGGDYAAGIGTGYNGNCGNITITNGVTKVTAKRVTDNCYCIGPGVGGSISGTVKVGDNTGSIGGSLTYTYQP